MSKIKLIITIVVILVIAFFAYQYFFVSNLDTSAGLKDVSKTSSSSVNGTSSRDINQNDQYVKQLNALQAISFNFDMFTDDAYKILKAANTDIPPEDKGRHNPFAPIEAGDGDFAKTVSATTTQVVATTTTAVPAKPKAVR